DARHGSRLHAVALALAALALVRRRVPPAAGHRHPLERGVRDVVADVVTDGELGAPVDLDGLDRVLVLLGQELGERVAVLVQVVAGVERLVREPTLADVDEVLFGIGHISGSPPRAHSDLPRIAEIRAPSHPGRRGPRTSVCAGSGPWQDRRAST